MSKEEINDNEIAPQLLALALRCQDAGLGFFAVVEYGDDPDADDFAMTANIPIQSTPLGKRVIKAAQQAGDPPLLMTVMREPCAHLTPETTND